VSSLTSLRITALAGGVGAARFLRGVVRVVPETSLSVIVNTGDDEEFFGLSVSPDLDTVTYTLANAVDSEKGWGLPQETHRCLEALGRYYADTWFGLGDSDLATHLFRTQALGRGQTLSQVTEAITHKWDIEASVLPMSNERVRTVVHTEAGALPFQEYFVKQRGEGHVSKVEFRGLETAQAAPGVVEAIHGADLVILPPSNPIVSIGPILSLPGVREALRVTTAAVVAISPLVAGKPIKGPADRMLEGLGIEVSSVGVAELYQDFVDTFVLDQQDVEHDPAPCGRLEKMGMAVIVTDTVMSDMDKSIALARTVIEFAHQKRPKAML
jgi:LPPG:FO 2-phospho-L-lactate transferase